MKRRMIFVFPVAFLGWIVGADQERRPRCHPSYPDHCIAPPPPDLDCKDVRGKKPFRVRSPDPHRFDADRDGWGCEG